MQFKLFFIAAVLADLAFAVTYDIKLYKDAHCAGTVGVKCTKKAAGECCAQHTKEPKKKGENAWSLNTSGNYVETGASKPNGNDQIKVYTGTDNTACNMPIDQDKTCASHNTKQITGAAVYVVVPTGSGRSSRHSSHKRTLAITRTVEPDHYFHEDGKHEYTIPIKSSRGLEYAALTTREEQVGFLKAHGKRSEL